ncbi:hypothetical protein VVMO6_02930 [Vibrio vulnificus MO6-24/O]|nr:hypothetical protein VVMO6_02930 [Vibrio vulnificus MO6-24/O]
MEVIFAVDLQPRQRWSMVMKMIMMGQSKPNTNMGMKLSVRHR